MERVALPSWEEKNVVADYIKESIMLAGVSPGSLAGIRVAIDASNGAAGPAMADLLNAFSEMSCTTLYFEPDGNFPNHDPDPTIEKNLADIKEVMKREPYTCGIAFDGDGDRIVFLDERGEVAKGGIATALIASILLRENKGATIVYTVIASRAVPEAIQAHGGRASVAPIGQAFIKPQMQKEDALFAGESSGHYTIGEGRFYEVPFMMILLVLREIAETKKPLSALMRELAGMWHHSGEINFEVENKEEIMAVVERKFSDAKITKIDGIRVDYPDWWFLLRPSNTEPLFRLVVEADSEEKMKQKVEELTNLIG